MDQLAGSDDGTIDRDFLFRVTRDDATEMMRLARSHGAIPVTQSYFADFGYFPMLSDALWEAAEDTGTLFVDHSLAIQQALDRMPRESIYFSDSHLRPSGYEVVARNLATALAADLRAKKVIETGDNESEPGAASKE